MTRPATVYRDHNDALPERQVCGLVRDIDAGFGELKRRVPCDFPAWWERLWHNVQPGDIWVCKRCHQRYRWTRVNGWARES